VNRRHRSTNTANPTIAVIEQGGRPRLNIVFFQQLDCRIQFTINSSSFSS
jgi:hypothetical protein